MLVCSSSGQSSEKDTIVVLVLPMNEMRLRMVKELAQELPSSK